MPTRKPWDHVINLKEDFVLKKERTYLMSRQKKEKVRGFVKEQLRKGYIRPSKLPQTSLVFFVGKKNGKKKIVQNYQYLNKRTKDNYLLSLILDLIDTMGTKRVFTKMDLQWEYNNVWVKKGNEWKTVFTMHLEVYEPTVMFFGLTNSLVIFQAMINDFLRDLINTGEVVAFMNNVLVTTEKKEKHDRIIKEVLRRMKENDLYVKPEKCI